MVYSIHSRKDRKTSKIFFQVRMTNQFLAAEPLKYGYLMSTWNSKAEAEYSILKYQGLIPTSK